ncbi:hypothetical protein [Acinetobacter haemolyticus]|jgi:sterol desaturase/sphingolipid hydroxylase (fatty acid hydroxylase superfamily)|uniref:Uncharacterized protein n=3 Tax=Acinetobacter TaxID=469 RepID=A0A372MN23_ACIHA|nr:hypothetical protein [Acinetobacter haemolyticus]NAR51316.1 hypothetical protein [Acinetobacter haemolyticus]NAR56367.1 hypothetical protein [Acinetobacter haemolyticus]NAR62170.1 hypothetical protein [Acinetobacter haemolyticus]NAR71568.1 hypothetical protein [Acinetobacter haemolyticus]NAR79258.1 hypothetical protein [Acinetobacter haemolyticus]
MLDNLPIIVFLGLILGFLFGKFYEIVFRGCAKFLLKIMTTQDGKSTRRKIISYALSGIVVVFFFLYLLLLSPFISDELWVYCYNSYFLGIGIGLMLKKQYFNKKY